MGIGVGKVGPLSWPIIPHSLLTGASSPRAPPHLCPSEPICLLSTDSSALVCLFFRVGWDTCSGYDLKRQDGVGAMYVAQPMGEQPKSRYRDQTEQLSQGGGKFGSVETSTHLLLWPYNGTEEGTEGS